MKKISLILIVVLSSSCSDYELFPESHIPEELSPIVDEFIAQARAHGRSKEVKNLRQRLDLSYEEGMTKRKMLGYCDPHGRQIVITLDKEYSEFTVKYHYERMYTLIFHELGHGFLHRKHVTGRSIMNPEYAQNEDWRSMLPELFE